MKISFLPPAQAELDEAYSWYAEQAVGLGFEFLDAFDQSVRLVASCPEMFEQVDGDIRRCLINRFPYGIIYGLDGDGIIVVAVAHVRRVPRYWSDRKVGLQS